jgi:ketosteroid isomerase-like protein
MSQENVEIVRKVYKALNRRDWDAGFHDMDPAFEMTLQRAPGPGTRRGRKQVQEFVEEYSAAFDKHIYEPEEFLQNGDQVVVLLTRRARPKGGSGEMVVRNGHLWTVRDGTILSMKSFPDPEEALKATGLRE